MQGRHFVSSIISTLASINIENEQSRGRIFPDSARSLLLTLHVLLPQCLLDALDLLDRGLVTRLVLDCDGTRGRSSTEKKDPTVAYLVRSAQKQEYRRGTRNLDVAPQGQMPVSTYHVHLKAWNCSCPAFAFAAYTDFNYIELDENVTGLEEETPCSSEVSASFGGLTKSDGLPPICKHLLACFLAEQCPNLFPARSVNPDAEGNEQHAHMSGLLEKKVDVNELAGYAAGSGF